MATTLDYQKALKLRKDSWMNMSIPEAVAQVRTQALQPIAWQPPAISNPQNVQPIQPQAPLNANQAVLQQNQANVQAEIQAWQRPAVGQQATPQQAPEIIPQAQIQKAQANTKGWAFAFENSTSAQNPETLHGYSNK